MEYSSENIIYILQKDRKQFNVKALLDDSQVSGLRFLQRNPPKQGDHSFQNFLPKKSEFLPYSKFIKIANYYS